jgi:hypothetical protein
LFSSERRPLAAAFCFGVNPAAELNVPALGA